MYGQQAEMEILETSGSDRQPAANEKVHFQERALHGPPSNCSSRCSLEASNKPRSLGLNNISSTLEDGGNGRDNKALGTTRSHCRHSGALGSRPREILLAWKLPSLPSERQAGIPILGV